MEITLILSHNHLKVNIGGANLLDTFDGVIFVTNSDAETLEGEVTGTEIGVPDLNGIKSLMIVNIFTIGILAGLLMGIIFWRKL